MKKIKLLSLFALLFLISTKVNAAEISIEGNKNVLQGESFEVNISLTKEETDIEYLGLESTLNYDETKIEYVEHELVFSNWTSTPSTFPTTAYYGSGVKITENGKHTIYKVKFKVKDNAILGQSEISFSSIKLGDGSAELTLDDVKQNKYTFNITNEGNGIKSIDISSGELEPEFNSGTYEYTIKNITDDEFKIQVILFNGSTSEETSKSVKMESDEESVTFDVTGEDGEKRTYKFNLKKAPVDKVENPQTGINMPILTIALILIAGIGMLGYAKKYNKFPRI